MNFIFNEKLDQFMIIYIDDIFVYSKTMEEHVEHLEYVLNKLHETIFLPIGQKMSLTKKKWTSSNTFC